MNLCTTFLKHWVFHSHKYFHYNLETKEIFIFYTEIFTIKVVLRCYFYKWKIPQLKILSPKCLYRTYFFSNEMEKQPRFGTYFYHRIWKRYFPPVSNELFEKFLKWRPFLCGLYVLSPFYCCKIWALYSG